MLVRRELLRRMALAAAVPAWHPRPSAAQGVGTDYDVLVIGAGVAGLAAANALVSADRELKVLVLEARDRLGGRVYSVEHSQALRRIEMGARFLLHPAGADWPALERLALSTQEDSGSLRVLPGMQMLVDRLAAAATGLVQLNSTVTEVLWRDGLVGVYYRNRGLESAVTARRLVCTLPSPVLASNRVRFTPDFGSTKREAMAAQDSTAAVSVAFLWEAEGDELIAGPLLDSADLAIWLSPTAEAGLWLFELEFRAQRAQTLAGQSEELLCAFAGRELQQRAGIRFAEQPRWQKAVDWSSDVFSGLGRGISQSDAEAEALAEPLADTLFFAGDATALATASGTVHGAFDSGERAARQVAESLQIGSLARPAAV